MALSSNTSAVDSVTAIPKPNLPICSSRNNFDADASKVAGKNPDDMKEKHPSVSMTSHTNLTMVTTRSSGSCESNESTRDRDDSTFSRTKLDSRDLTESKSSTSYPSVIRNWANKYDTDEKDNYDSYSDDEAIYKDQRKIETREDVEERYRGEIDHRTIKNIDGPEKSKIEEGTAWGCRFSYCLDHTDGKKSPAKSTQDYSKSQFNADSSDNDSSTAWFLNNSYESYKRGKVKHAKNSMRTGGSPTSYTAGENADDNPADPLLPDCMNKTTKIAIQKSMVTKLDQLIFELDKFSLEDKEEEIVFHVGDGEKRVIEELVEKVKEKNATLRTDLCSIKERKAAEVTEINEFRDAESLSKINDALDAMACLCSVPQSQQLLLEHESSEKPLPKDDSKHDKVDSSKNEDLSNQNYIIKDNLHHNQSKKVGGTESLLKVGDALDAIACLCLTSGSQNLLLEDNSKLDKIESNANVDLSNESYNSKVELHRNQYNKVGGEQLPFKATDALDAMACLCLTSGSQNLLLEDNFKLDNINASKSKDSICADSNIEVELRQHENSEEEDEVVVLNAVARALRKSKKRSKGSPRKSKRWLNSKESNKISISEDLTTDYRSSAQVCSDSTEILASLNFMKFINTSKNTPLNEDAVEQPKSSKSDMSTRNDTGIEVHNIKSNRSNHSARVIGKDPSPKEFESRDYRDDDQSSHDCSDGIAAIRSPCFGEKEKNDKIKNADDTTVATLEQFETQNQSQDDENEKSVLSLSNHGSFEENTKKREDIPISKETQHEPRIEQTKRGKNSSIIEVKTCDENTKSCIFDLKREVHKNSCKNFEEPSSGFQSTHTAIEKIDLMIDSDSFSIDGFCENPIFDDDRMQFEPTKMLGNTLPKPSQHRALMTSLGSKEKNHMSYNQLGTMSSSFDLFTSTLSSDDCCIPSPPYRSKCEATFNNESKLESLSFNVPTSKLAIHTHSLPIPNQALPMISSERHDSFPAPISPLLKKKIGERKKKKGLRLPSKVDERLLQSLNHVAGKTKDERRRRQLPHLPINELSCPKIERKNEKIESLHLDLGKLAEDSLRLERKMFSLPSPKRKFRFDENKNIFRDQNNKDQENYSPNPFKEPRHKHVKESSLKGILRIQDKSIPTSPKIKRRVHWDEEQLASKVEKGMMVLSSQKRRRPIRRLEKLMRRIVVVQNRNNKGQNPGEAKGYMC